MINWYQIIFVTFLILTGKDNKENDGNIDEEELEVSKVTEDLRNKNSRQPRSDTLWIFHWFHSYYWLWKQLYIQNRGEWHWCTGWCYRGPWTWTHRRRWWEQHVPPCKSKQTLCHPSIQHITSQVTSCHMNPFQSSMVKTQHYERERTNC